jgi:alpha-beta hydrolase superfamily lysophospholipase
MMKYIAALLSLLCCLSTHPAGAREVRFSASDGHPLSASLDIPDQNTDIHVGVILLPMYRHTKESWQPLVRQLTAAGFTCLSLDLRGHGKSRFAADGSDDAKKVNSRDPVFFNTMYQDVAAADNWLKREEPQLEKRVIIGASVGCSVAVHAITVGAVKADAAVLMTPGKNYLGIPTMEHIKAWPGIPLLILSSREEQDRGAAAIFNELQKRSAEIKLFPQNNIHGTNMFGRVDGIEKLIVDWLLAAVDVT